MDPTTHQEHDDQITIKLQDKILTKYSKENEKLTLLSIVSVDTNFLTTQRMVTEDPRGRRRRILYTVNQLTTTNSIPTQEGARSLHSQSDRHVTFSGYVRSMLVVTQTIQDLKFLKGCV